MSSPVISEKAHQDGDDKVARGHEEGAGDEDRFPTKLVDPDDCRDCGEEHPVSQSAPG